MVESSGKFENLGAGFPTTPGIFRFNLKRKKEKVEEEAQIIRDKKDDEMYPEMIKGA